MTGLLALHGGGEYVTGDEPSMDVLMQAAIDAAAADGPATVPRVIVVPTAAARQRPDAAARNGERGFVAAARRAGVAVEIGVVGIVSRADAMDPRVTEPLAGAHLIHLPGGDPDLIPAVLRDSPAWTAMRRAYDRSAVIAGASAGAMALAGTCWTPGGPVDGLDLLPGFAILPHDGPGRLDRWRSAAPGVAWLGIGEQTLVIGRPGSSWIVAGRGRVRVIAPDGAERASAGPGERIHLG